MTRYIVTCETCLHRSTYPTHEAATDQADEHARKHPDHTVTVEEEPNDRGGVAA